MRGKCNCGKKATGEWSVTTLPSSKKRYGTQTTLKFCDDCKPKLQYTGLTLIYGK